MKKILFPFIAFLFLILSMTSCIEPLNFEGKPCRTSQDCLNMDCIDGKCHSQQNAQKDGGTRTEKRPVYHCDPPCKESELCCPFGNFLTCLKNVIHCPTKETGGIGG